MSTHNIEFHVEIRQFPIFFVFLSNQKNFAGTNNGLELAMVNEPSGLELLRFDCIRIDYCSCVYLPTVQ